MLWFVGYWIFFGLWPKQNAGALPPRVALRAALSVRGAGCLDFLAHKRVLVNCSKSVSGVVVEVFGTMLVVFSSSLLDRWVVSTLGFVVLHGGVIFFLHVGCRDGLRRARLSLGAPAGEVERTPALRILTQ